MNQPATSGASMAGAAASWLPASVAQTVHSHRAAAAPLLAWLAALRLHLEEYDPQLAARPVSPAPAPQPRALDEPFDEILSQLGKEIYRLDEYQRHFHPHEQGQVSLSILNLFDECLGELTEPPEHALSDKCDTSEVSAQTTSDDTVSYCVNSVSVVNGDIANEMSAAVADCSECVSAETDVSRAQVSPARCSDVRPAPARPAPPVPVAPPVAPAPRAPPAMPAKRVPPPVPPRRLRPPSPVSITSFSLETTDNEDDIQIMESKVIESDSDSVSTCWSYKECSTDENDNSRDKSDAYAAVWSHSSGYHNSDKILERVLAAARPTAAARALEGGGRSSGGGAAAARAPVAMSPARPADHGYEPVRDALTHENIYEEIDYSYTDEGFSCGGSVEVESCSLSAGSGRDTPLYVNLQDHAAYAIPDDVIAWKNWLLDPFTNDDEEDEWITPEECAVYSREHRPPLVIPRITHYRARQERAHNTHGYSPEECGDLESLTSSRRDGTDDWSPASERRYDPRLDSPTPLRTRGKTSYEVNEPAVSSSGESLDVELRERAPKVRGRKARSLLAGKRKEPLPLPRTLLPAIDSNTAPRASIVHEGPVKRTKFSVNGRKCKKNWVDCYMVLSHTALIFYKDQRTFQARSPGAAGAVGAGTGAAGGAGGRAELVLALRGAQAVPALQMHTRRYQRSLLLMPGFDHYLVQDDSELSARRWLHLIQNQIYKLGPPCLAEFPPEEPAAPDDERHDAQLRQKASGSSAEDLSTDVRSKLKKFFAKRPPMETLVNSGIYKDEQVFGRRLEDVCPRQAPRVPVFVTRCIAEIERSEENMKTDGLYRASGNLSQVQKIRLEVDQERLEVLAECGDVHVLAGALKLFFRELKEPLIPCSFFARILAAPSLRPASARAAALRELVRELPAPNRDTLRCLLTHLLRVTSFSSVNRMTPANLAIVFGPTLLWAPPAPGAHHNLALDCYHQNNVVDALLTHYHEIFD